MGADVFVICDRPVGANSPEYLQVLAEKSIPTLLVTDRPWHGDIRDSYPNLLEPVRLSGDGPEAVLRKLALATRGRRVLGCLNTIENFVVPMTTFATHLGLPNPGLFASMLSRDKLLQRMHLRDWSPAWDLVSSNEIDEAIGPDVVVKQVDGTGGSGVRLVKRRAPVKDLIGMELSPHRSLLVEEFIPGRDVSVESLIMSGQVLFENMTEENNLEYEGSFLEMGYTMGPSISDSAIAHQLYELNRQIIKRIGFESGICHAEYRITESGRIVFIELAARPPGDGLMQLYQLTSGKRLEETIIEVLLGEEAAHPAPTSYARQIYFDPCRGRINGIVSRGGRPLPVHHCNEERPRPRVTGSDHTATFGVNQILIERAMGSEVPPLRGADDRIGSYIFSAATLDELSENEQAISADLCLQLT